MTEFKQLRRELEIEGQDDRKQRLKQLKKRRNKLQRNMRKVLKDIQHELFPESKVSKLDDHTWCVMRQVNPGAAMLEGVRGRRRRRLAKQKHALYDVAVRMVPDHETYPRGFAYLECWRNVTGEFSLADYPDEEHAPYATCAPDRDALVPTLVDLLRRFPPER